MEKTEVVVQPVSSAPVITKEVGGAVSPTPVKEAAPEAPTTDTPVVEVKEEPAKDDKYSGKIAKVQERERLVEDREKNAAEAVEKANAIVAADNETKALIKKRPLEVLKRFGITFEDLTKSILDEEDPDPKYEALKGELDEVKGKLSADEKAIEDAKRKADDDRIAAAEEGFKGRIKDVVEKGGDKFELIKLNEAQDLVFNVVQEYFEVHGTILDPEKAAESVEDWLLKKAELLSKSKKLGAKTPEAESVKSATKLPPTKTLTNQASNFAAPVLPAGQKLSKDERMKKAAAMIRFS